MTNRELAKEIRNSLKYQPAYLNRKPNRLRIYDAKATTRYGLLVKTVQNTPGKLGHGRIAWITVPADESVTIFAGTVMEETYGGGSVRI